MHTYQQIQCLFVSLVSLCFVPLLNANIDEFGALDDHNICRNFDSKKICAEDISLSDISSIRSLVQFLFEKDVETNPFYDTDRFVRLQYLEDALAVTYNATQIDSNSNMTLSEVSSLYQSIRNRIQELMNMYFKSSEMKIRRSAIQFYNGMYSRTENIMYPMLFDVLNENVVQTTYADVAEKEIDDKKTASQN